MAGVVKYFLKIEYEVIADSLNSRSRRVPLVFNSQHASSEAIDNPWNAYSSIVDAPSQSNEPGFQVHIFPGNESGCCRRFSLNECKAIAFGTVFYDSCIYQLQPIPHSKSTEYQAYTSLSPVQFNKRICDFKQQLDNFSTVEELVKKMQEMMQGDEGKVFRYVFWNFANITSKERQAPNEKSATIEFRVGRGLRDEAKTKRWIAFSVAFIDMCLTEFLVKCTLQRNGSGTSLPAEVEPEHHDMMVTDSPDVETSQPAEPPISLPLLGPENMEVDQDCLSDLGEDILEAPPRHIQPTIGTIHGCYILIPRKYILEAPLRHMQPTMGTVHGSYIFNPREDVLRAPLRHIQPTMETFYQKLKGSASRFGIGDEVSQRCPREGCTPVWHMGGYVCMSHNPGYYFAPSYPEFVADRDRSRPNVARFYGNA